MTIIKKAILKEYFPLTHTADVQLVGSPPLWMAGLHVATDIPAADLLPTRACTVLFLDPGNPIDALLLTIQGALPSSGGITDHGLLSGLGDPDHSAYGPLASPNVWAALQTFNAGLKLAATQQIQDSAGAGRILLATASPHLTLSGDLRANGFIGINTAPDPLRRLKLVESGTLAASAALAEFTTSALTLPTGINLTALIGVPLVTVAPAAVNTAITGLNFSFGATGGTAGATMLYARGVDIRSFFPAWSGALSELTGIYLSNQAISGSGSVALATGIHIEAWGNDTQVVDYYGLRIFDPTLNTGFRRLIEAGPATPNLRLEANAPTVSGQSKLLLSFYDGAVVALRRVLMGAANSGGAGFRMLTVPN